MVLTDPRETFVGYFSAGVNDKITGANLLNEDASLSSYKAQWDFSHTPLEKLFHAPYNHDIVFVITRESMTALGAEGNPFAYRYVIGIQPTSIDKNLTNTTYKVLGAKLIWMAEQEVLRVIRVNSIGSYRGVSTGKPANLDDGSTILYGNKTLIEYVQYVTAYGTYTLANRRFFNFIKEWRVGLGAGTYSSAGESSGLGPLSWTEPDPWKRIDIKGADRPIYLPTLGYHVDDGVFYVHDREAVTQLLRTIDVSADAGTNVAVARTTPGRYVIDYLAFTVYNTKIVNATDVRTSELTTYVFSKARIHQIVESHKETAGPWEIHFSGDSPVQDV